MKTLLVILTLFVILILGSIQLQNSFADAPTEVLTAGIKDNPGSWWVGEGLKKGDFFSYDLCYVYYKDCTKFQMDIWFEGDIKVETETKWLVQVVVYDGPFVIPGNMELGKIAPEPTGGSKDIGPYRSAYKSSIIWLSAFANADKPKEFNKPSWGKIANIGGQQIIPTEMQTITVPAMKNVDTALISWRTGGQDSKVWVLDDFPFPIKAFTYVHVATGIPPTEYEFELLDYKENVLVNPFANVKPFLPGVGLEGCIQNYELVDVKKATADFLYIMDLKYGPPNPETGCEIEWFIGFKRNFADVQFEDQVQYDILVVDDNFTLPPIRSLAQEEGKKFLYAPSGFVHTNTIVKENPGIAHYVIWILGTSPKTIVAPIEELDYLQIDIPISEQSLSTPTPTTTPSPKVPSWIKTTAGFWVDGFSSDNEFVNAIEFLINEGIIVIPPTASGGEIAAEVPSWIQTTTGFWVDGFTSDEEFVSAIQWLIKNGIMRIA